MTPSQMKAMARVLEADSRIAYGLIFGSVARDRAHASSDVDVAVESVAGVRLDALALGRLVADLEHASGHAVDLVLLDEARPSLAYRVFRDGIVVFVRNRSAMVERRARAVMDYLDYRPFEAAFVRGVLQPRG